MKTLKVIGNCCCLFLAIIGALVSIVYGYYQIFVKDYTTGTNYIGDQIPIDLVEKAEDLTQEEIDIYNKVRKLLEGHDCDEFYFKIFENNFSIYGVLPPVFLLLDFKYKHLYNHLDHTS